MSWCSRSRWRAACRHRDDAELAREIARQIKRAHEAEDPHFMLHWLDGCLDDEKQRLHPRLFNAATRPLLSYLRADLARVSLALQELR
jgi:hypothetical protein